MRKMAIDWWLFAKVLPADKETVTEAFLIRTYWKNFKVTVINIYEDT